MGAPGASCHARRLPHRESSRFLGPSAGSEPCCLEDMSSVARNPGLRIQSREQPARAHGVHVRIAATTDVGRVRERNEDAVVVRDLGHRASPIALERVEIGPLGVLVAVADGMGGADRGDVASAMLIDHLTRSLENATLDTPPEVALTTAARAAHDAIWSAGEQNGRRMGSTLTAALLHDDAVTIAQVGDSRAYVLRNGQMLQLTQDQSVVQALIDAGLLDEEKAMSSPYRNVILQAVGHQEALTPAITRLQLRARDCLLLCTDGLTGLVRPSEILRVVRRSFRLDIAAERLVALANERGGDDNISVVLAGIGGDLPASTEEESLASTLAVLKPFVAKLP